MTISANSRRLAFLGGALALTLASAAWLFFGASEADVGTATAAPARRSPARAVAAPAPAADSARQVAAAGGGAVTDTRARRTPAAAPAAPTTATIEREVFAYAGDGRRDPFRALIATNAIRPMPNELRLVAVVFDPRGQGSVAILRDSTTKKQHRVRPGQLLGRMRVAQIRPKQVVFTIEELGFSRQEILALHDSTATRLP